MKSRVALVVTTTLSLVVACGGQGQQPAGDSASAAPVDVVPGALVALLNRSAPVDDVFSAQFCGGVLIAPDVVATAAHCVVGRRAARTDVLVGADNLCGGSAVHGQRLHVRRVRVSPGSAPDLRRDVAVLELERAATTPPAQVGDARLSGPWTAWGWGHSSLRGALPCRPSAVRLVPIDDDSCRSAADEANVAYDPRFGLCARPTAGESRNTCVGDSGGPVFAGSVLVALTSWGKGCAGTDVGGYARVEELRAHAGRSWPPAP